MSVEPEFVEYHRSIADELKTTQNRVRNLIRDRHWLTDGEYKEVILRKVLKSCLPEFLHVGRGFVCYSDGASTQLDVLITDKRKPTLFQEGDLVIVTSDCVEAIIEVKTKLSLGATDLGEVLSKLAEQAQKVEKNIPNKKCWAGLLVYDSPDSLGHEGYEGTAKKLLKRISEACTGDEAKIDCVAFGPQMFIRYWPGAIVDVGEPGWSCYAFNKEPHARLAPAYFVSNLVWDVSSGLADTVKYAWFPVNKEQYRVGYITLEGRKFQT
jgi:hypothetical protein